MTTDNQGPTNATPEPSSRRRFLRQAGSLLGAGAGVLLLASPAQAAPPSYTCCRESTCDPCGSGQNRYRCTPRDGCSGSGFCGCFSNDKPQCFTRAC